MKTISKKAKRIIIISASAIIFLALLTVFILSYHHIYAFCEKLGLFRIPLKIEPVDGAGFTEYSIEELLADENVRMEQSLMLVNTTYMLPEDFVPDVVEYKDTTVYMSRPMIDAYAQLSAAVKNKTCNKLYVSSDLRGREEQEDLYKEDPETATKPGASEHQSGLALDVYVAYYAGDGFLKSPSGRYVNSHAHEYGFIIRYPSYAEDITGIRYEPWHIRYVGEPHAKAIYNNHITLEEYILSFEIGEWYKIDGYLVSRQGMGDTVIMPEKFHSCVISPDNTGCYIITVQQ